jgi:hypothetical protein
LEKDIDLPKGDTETISGAKYSRVTEDTLGEAIKSITENIKAIQKPKKAMVMNVAGRFLHADERSDDDLRMVEMMEGE